MIGLTTTVSLTIAADGDALRAWWARSSTGRNASPFTGCDVSAAGIILGAVIIGLAFLRNEHVGFDGGIGNGLIGFDFLGAWHQSEADTSSCRTLQNSHLRLPNVLMSASRVQLRFPTHCWAT